MDDMPDLRALAGRLQELFDTSHTLAAMESCTGGLLASALTDIPGSGYLLASAVCYDAGAKVALGVPAGLIERHGAVSAEVAGAMATAAARFFGAEFGLSTTGVAGSEPEDGVAPGTVWVATCDAAGTTHARRFRFEGDREFVKYQAARAACALLLANLPFAPEAGVAPVEE